MDDSRSRLDSSSPMLANRTGRTYRVSSGSGPVKKDSSSNHFQIPSRKSKDSSQQRKSVPLLKTNERKGESRGRIHSTGASIEERLANCGIELGLGGGIDWNSFRQHAQSKTGTNPLKNGPVHSGTLSGRSSGTPRSINSLTPRTETPRRKAYWKKNNEDHEWGGMEVNERKSARLTSDISRRITGMSTSIDKFDKNVRDVKETMNEAYRRSMHDKITNKLTTRKNSAPELTEESNSNKSPDIDKSTEKYLRQCRDNLTDTLFAEIGEVKAKKKSLDIPMGPGGDNIESIGRSPLLIRSHYSPRAVFGLDANSMLKTTSSSSSSSSEEDSEDSEDSEETSTDSSSSSSSSEEESGPATMRISIRHTEKGGKSAAMKRFQENIKNRKNQQPAPPTRPKGKTNKKDLQEPEPRSLSPIMPTIPDKQFKTILEKREERANRHLNSMKNGLEQLNQKVEMDKKKAAVSASVPSIGAKSIRGKMEGSYQGIPMRLMQSHPPKKDLSKEYNEFVQRNGGMTGGWERKDHNVFLKAFDIWRKYPIKLMEALKKELSHKKSKEIASHIKWFEQFEELSRANKVSVHKWSQDKRKENEVVYQMGSATRLAKQEGERRRQEHLRMVREQERDKGREKLAEWKTRQRAGPSTLQNPTKQSEIRKTLTHLEKLETLSKKDLNMIANGTYANRFDGSDSGVTFSPIPMMPKANPSKAIPSWRKSNSAGGFLQTTESNVEWTRLDKF